MGGESHNPLLLDETEYSVSIDYTMSLEEMVKAGNYDWKSKDINASNFPVIGSGTPDLKLRIVHLNREATTKEVEEYLETMNLRPATLVELLAFGVEYQDKQREFNIFVLGSSWGYSGGGCSVPFISVRGGRRPLGLWWSKPNDQWNTWCQFLAVSK